jgi:hypothetical protein
LETFTEVEITLEPNPDPDPGPSGQIVFSEDLPSLALSHVRHLLVSCSSAPDEVALVQGLHQVSMMVDQNLQKMLADFLGGDQDSVRLQAEGLTNMLVGSNSPEYRDWNEDGQITDLGDGYGLLPNGENAGYIGLVASHAKFAADAPDSTESIIWYGNHVMESTKNIQQWALELRDLLIELQSEEFGPETEEELRQAVSLSNLILTGIDLNGNGTIEPLLGEGGMRTVYKYAYFMADINLFESEP